MIELVELIGNDLPGSDTLPWVELPIDLRIKSRQRVVLNNGESAGLFLTRGTVLRDGDVVASQTGERVRIKAAPEKVSTARTDDALTLARAAWHLGNRHVPVQITESFVRYQHDHVLDDMLQRHGLQVTVEMAPFEPEAGAYQQQGSHGHSHGHSHDHTHDHSHDHSHHH